MATPMNSALVTIPRMLRFTSALKGLVNASDAIVSSTARIESLPGSSSLVLDASTIDAIMGG